MIFDEATSALDKKNEAEVQKAIDEMRKELGNVTTIVIAHRLSTVRSADKIMVMKKGKLIEQGTHDELLSQFPDGGYAKLVRQQEAADQTQLQKQRSKLERQSSYNKQRPSSQEEKEDAGVS